LYNSTINAGSIGDSSYFVIFKEIAGVYN